MKPGLSSEAGLRRCECVDSPVYLRSGLGVSALDFFD
jgi:hypothetical protein